MPDIINGRYVVVKNHPSRTGGLSVVRKAMDSETGDSVAVKFISAPDGALTRKIFEREVSTLRRLDHPNIITLLDAGIDESGTYYVVFPWVESSLLDRIADTEPCTWDEALGQYALPLSHGLAHAHLQRVEHRDIKPGNVLIEVDNRPLLADFGIGKIRGEDQTGLTVGAFRSGVYAPPEDVDDLPYVRDVYSLGVLIAQLMSNSGLSTLHEVQQVISDLSMPPDARRLLEDCVSLDPSVRPSNGSVLHQALLRLGIKNKERIQSAHFVGWLALTNAAREALESPTGDGDDGKGADQRLLSDIQNEPVLTFRWDAPTAQHDTSTLMLYGDSWRFTIKPDNNSGSLVVIAAKRLEFEQLEGARRHGIPIGEWIQWGTRKPQQQALAVQGCQQLIHALEDHYAKVEADSAQHDRDASEDELLDTWLRTLNAREELARGDRQPRDYDGVVEHGREITVTLLAADSEENLLGTEWNLTPRGFQHHLARGEVVAQKDSQLILLRRDKRRGPLPDKGTLVPNLGPSEIALQRQRDAVTAVRNRTSGLPTLGALIADPALAHPPAPLEIGRWNAEHLDDDKKTAVAASLGSSDLFVVQGPPGTGKTSFIAELVAQHLERKPESRVLVVSQTHVAVDNALQRITSTGTDHVVRLGLPDDPRVSPDTRHLLLDQQMGRWAKQVKRSAEEHLEHRATQVGLRSAHLKAALALQQFAETKKLQDRLDAELALSPQDLTTSLADSLELSASNLDLQDRVDNLVDQANRLYTEASQYLGGDLTLPPEMSAQDAETTVGALIGDGPQSRQLLELVKLQGEWLQRVGSDDHLAGVFLDSTQVIGGTCIGFLKHPAVRSLEIDLCILDEASKATTTQALVPMSRARRTVLVGDVNQLPPHDEDLLRRRDLMADHELEESEVRATLFQRLASGLPDSNQHQLTVQYRMIRPIGDLISDCFYEGTLRSPLTTGLTGYELLGKPVLWLDTSHMGKSRHENPEGGGGGSYANRTEAQIVIDRVKAIEGALDKGILHLPSGEVLDVLIIAPYRSQVAELRRRISAVKSTRMRISVESVDAVQGREADIAIFSVTRSNPGTRMGFLGPDYWRRINVALSRARFGLTIVGDAEFCQAIPGALQGVLRYIKEHPGDCEQVRA